jgi:hypothetical protein
MSPQHSSPAPAASRCRDALQVNVCTEYKSVHVSDHITSSDSRHIVPNGGLLSCCVPPSEIGGRTRNAESIFRPANELMCVGIARFTLGCSGGSQLRFSPIDKHNKFNRMNGSPGDPPANRMHISKQKESLLLLTVSRVIQSARRPTGRQQHKEIQ